MSVGRKMHLMRIAKRSRREAARWIQWWKYSMIGASDICWRSIATLAKPLRSKRKTASAPDTTSIAAGAWTPRDTL
jgi:hypothetical protein